MPSPDPVQQGIAFFVRALPAARAEAVRAAVEAAAAPLDPAPGDPDWETYYLFLECIDKRAAKVGWAACPPFAVVHSAARHVTACSPSSAWCLGLAEQPHCAMGSGVYTQWLFENVPCCASTCGPPFFLPCRAA